MRVLQAIRFTGSLFLLPGLLVALWLFRGVLSSAESGYALAATGRGSGAVILVAPLLAAACAWSGARVHRVRRTYTNSCRSSLVVVLDALWPLILTGVIAVLAAILAEFSSQQIPLRPDPGILAVSVVLITAVCLASFALGTRLTPLISAPLALSVTYAWLVIPWTLEPLWIRHMNGNLSGCCMIHQVLSVKVIASALALYGAIAAASLLLLVVVRRRAVGLTLGAISAVILLGGISTSQALVSGRQATAGTARTEGLRCRQGRVEVCVWKEHADQLPLLSATADGFAAKLAARGVDTIDRLTESHPSATPRTGSFMVSEELTDDEVKTSVAQGFAPSLSSVPGCENKIYSSSQQDAARQFLIDVAVAENWVKQILKVPTDNQLTNPQSLRTRKTLRSSSPAAQARWFLAVSSAVETCDPSARTAG